MKKIFTLMLLALATLGTKAGEYVAYQPTAPVAISWDTSKYSGEQFDSKDKASFVTLSKDDVIKIHITNVGSEFDYELDYKTGGNWDWTKLETGVTQSDGVISYTVQTDEIATLIKERGLVVKGIYFNMLDITVSSSNVESDGSYTFRTIVSESKALGDEDDTNNDTKAWSPFVDLRYLDYTDVVANDIMRISYSVTNNKVGQIQLQKNWAKYGSDDTTDKGNLSGTGTIDLTITSEMLSIMQETENNRDDNFVLKGKNTTVTGVSIRKSLLTAGYRPVYIPASGYATFYGESTCALPAGVEAYYVPETTETSATLTTLSNIPANQGVILKGAEGIYQLYTTNDAAASVEGNMLSGSTSRQQITDASNKYVLNNSTPEFRRITANTYLDAYKCYLSASSAGAPSLSISFDGMGNTTGISNVQKTVVEDNRIYNLNGQEVKNAGKGIFIKNGKKYIIK